MKSQTNLSFSVRFPLSFSVRFPLSFSWIFWLDFLCCFSVRLSSMYIYSITSWVCIIFPSPWSFIASVSQVASYFHLCDHHCIFFPFKEIVILSWIFVYLLTKCSVFCSFMMIELTVLFVFSYQIVGSSVCRNGKRNSVWLLAQFHGENS